MKKPFTLSLLLLWIPSLCFSQMGAGNAISTNGSSTYASVAHSATLNASTALSIEAWIMPTSFGNNLWENVIVSKDDWSAGESGYSLRCGGNGILSFNLGITGNWQEAISPQSTLILNEWQHVAGTYDGSVIRVYHNGIEVGSTNSTGTINGSTFDLAIGRITYTAGGGRWFSGEIDEVRLWNSALPQASLRDYMCQSVNSSHPNYSSLMAYYSFDNATATNFSDLGPFGHDGLLYGAIPTTSDAALGNASSHNYSSPNNTSLTAPSNESLSASNVSGNPDGIHLYRVDGPPNPLNLPTGFSGIDTMKYWGVFFAGGSNPSADLSYGYGSGTYFNTNNECNAKVASRPAFSQTNWNSVLTQNDPANDQFAFSTARGEFVFGLSSGIYAPIANSNSEICQGDSSNLSIPAASGVGYQWFLNGSPLPGDTSNQLIATQTGSYHLAVSAGQCNFTTDTILLTVNPLPNVSFSPANNICILGGPDTLMALPAGGSFAGSGVTGNVLDPLQAGLGTHNLSYSYTDSNSCTVVVTDSVTVQPNPTAVFPGPQDYCLNEPAVQLTIAAPMGGQYSGSGVAAGSFDPAVAGLGAHVLLYTFTDGNGCIAEDSATYNVLPVPATPVVTQIGGDLISSSPTGNQWYNGNQPIAGETSANYTVPSAGGNFYVLVTGANGCQSDTSNQVLLVGLEESLNHQFSLFPNPSTGLTKLVWNHPLQGDFQLKLVDLNGKVVFQQSHQLNKNSKGLKLDLSGIPSGLYFLKLSSESGNAVRKLIIQ